MPRTRVRVQAKPKSKPKSRPKPKPSAPPPDPDKPTFIVRSARTILNEEMIEQFCDYVARGLPFDGCCDMLGISPSTFHTWKRRGQRWLDGDGKPKTDEIYGVFVNSVKRAFASYRLGIVDKMHSNSPYWVRDMTIMERRDRRNYCKSDPLGGTEDEYEPNEKFV